MKVLYFSQYYYPAGDVVSNQCETLKAMGHEIIVLTATPYNKQGEWYSGYRNRLWFTEEINGIKVIRVPIYPYFGNSKIKRFFNFGSFVFFSTLFGIIRTPKCDAMLGYIPPITLGIPAYILGKIKNMPYVLQVQDLWPEEMIESKVLREGLVSHWIGKLAQWSYRKATKIQVISEGFKSNLINVCNISEDKIHVIGNGINYEKEKPYPYDETFAKNHGMDGKFNILYGGNLGEPQHLETALDVAERLHDTHPDIQFVFVGDGVRREALEQIATDKKLKNVRFLGRFPPSSMGKFYAASDALLVHLEDQPVFRLVIPHKILTYLAAGKPVLGGVKGDAMELLEKAGAGIPFQPQSEAGLLESILDLYNMPEVERRKMGQNGTNYARQHYDFSITCRQISDLLQKAVDTKKRNKNNY